MKKTSLFITVMLLCSIAGAQESAPEEGWPRVYESEDDNE